MPSGNCGATEKVGNRVPALGAWVPDLANCRHMLRSPCDVERAPIQSHEIDWLSRRNCCFKQLLLLPRESERRPAGPLAAHVLTLTKDEHRDLRVFDEADGVPELRLPRRVGGKGRLRALKLIIEDAWRQITADLDPFAEVDCDSRREASAETLEHCDCVVIVPGQAPGTHGVRLRVSQGTNDRDRVNLLVQRKQTILIAQQHSGAGRYGTRSLALFRRNQLPRNLG